MYTCTYNIYDPLLLTKNLNFRQKYSFLTPFLSQFVLCLTSHNITSQNIGGTDAWEVTPPQFSGEPSPSSPKSPPMPPLVLLNVYLPICLSVCLLNFFICKPLYVPVCVCVYVCVYVSVCVY